jgi:hypothetical protein
VAGIFSDEELDAIEKEIRAEFSGDQEREGRRPAWKSIDSLAAQYDDSSADAPDPQEFRRRWEEVTGREMNVQAYRWARKKSKHFNRLYGSSHGPRDFGIGGPFVAHYRKSARRATQSNLRY